MDKKLFIYTLLIGALMVLGVVIYEGDSILAWLNGDNPFVGFINKFQTLISGVIALIAALLTVRAMMQSDAKQDRRHTITTKLSLRRDRLLVQRACDPQIEELRSSAIRFKDFRDYLVNIERGGLPPYFSEIKGHEGIRSIVMDVQEIVGRKQLDDVIVLMDAKCIRSLQRVPDACKVLLQTCDLIEKKVASPSDISDSAAVHLNQQLIVDINSLVAQIMALHGALEELQVNYEEV